MNLNQSGNGLPLQSKKLKTYFQSLLAAFHGTLCRSVRIMEYEKV
jgi:hypothetical protein